MPKSYVALAPVEYVDRGVAKTTFRRIGPAFPARDGEGFDINIELLPPPQVRYTKDSKGNDVFETYWRILVREKTESAERQSFDRPPSKPQRPAGPDSDPVDDIPF